MNQLQLHVIVILNKRARTDRSRRCNTWAKTFVCAQTPNLEFSMGKFYTPLAGKLYACNKQRLLLWSLSNSPATMKAVGRLWKSLCSWLLHAINST